MISTVSKHVLWGVIGFCAGLLPDNGQNHKLLDGWIWDADGKYARFVIVISGAILHKLWEEESLNPKVIREVNLSASEPVQEVAAGSPAQYDPGCIQFFETPGDGKTGNGYQGGFPSCYRTFPQFNAYGQDDGYRHDIHCIQEGRHQGRSPQYRDQWMEKSHKKKGGEEDAGSCCQCAFPSAYLPADKSG